MYCSLEEAWPNMRRNNINNNIFRQNNLICPSYSPSIIHKNNISDNYYDDFKLPHNNINVENNNDKNIEKISVQSEKNNIIEKFNQDDKCIRIMEHITVCDECLKNLYKKFSFNRGISYNYGLETLLDFFRNIGNNFNKIVEKDKDLVSSILVGLLIILIIHFLKSG